MEVGSHVELWMHKVQKDVVCGVRMSKIEKLDMICVGECGDRWLRIKKGQGRLVEL